jgi:hypothetical protein
MSEFTPNCRCKPGSAKIYLERDDPEGKLIVDHEPVIRPRGEEELEWPGGVCIERRYESAGKQYRDFVILSFTEAEKVRDALNVFLWDHQL